MPRSALRLLNSSVERTLTSLLLLLISVSSLLAQNPSGSGTAPSVVHALFLSDIHFDPYADPGKVAQLNAAPAAKWNAILSGPPSATQAQDFAALQKSCPVRGIDTPNVLFQSALNAIHTDALRSRFITVSGDLLAHQFDCKYKTLVPLATRAEYLSFVEKTVGYIVTSLRTTLPGVPVYVALGNNDSGCTDYALEPSRDEFLARTAPIVATAADLTQQERTTALENFARDGSYSASLADIPRARMIVLDDLFSSGKYVTCGGKPDPAPAAAQLAWLETQLKMAREHNERVWVMGHIPPGVDLYSTARRMTNVCSGGQAQMFLGSEALPDLLSRYSDVVRLALFGHTHSDEMRLLTPQDATSGTKADASAVAGVPLKIVASISPVNGNRSTFTLASIDSRTATLVDYTVVIASNLTGVDTTWSPEYTYSATYHEPAFDADSLNTLITGFQADPSAEASASEAYLRDYFPGDASSIIKFVWPQYACSLDHDSAADYSSCICAGSSGTAK